MPDEPAGINSAVGCGEGPAAGVLVVTGGGTGKEAASPGSAVPTIGARLVAVGDAAGVAAGRQPVTIKTINTPTHNPMRRISPPAADT
jgi:hypothetical protein